MSSVIKVTNLGKSFIISHEGRDRYQALRDVISSKARKLFSFQGILKSSETSNKVKEEFWALRDVSFEIEKGDRVGIIGRNGAGKSTLLKILSRITEPTRGEVRIKGRVASLLEVGTGFHPELTGRENIYLNGAILGMSRLEIRKHFDPIVEFAEIEKFLDTPVKRYSSGMYVRLAFAVAAHLEPEILIIDEVLAVGDAQFQKKCLGKMEDVSRNEGRTVLFVSHNVGLMKHLCNKGLLLDSGSLTYSGGINSAILAYSNVFSNSETAEYRHIAGNQAVSVEKLIIENIESIEMFGKISVRIDYMLNSSSAELTNQFHFFVLFYNDAGDIVWSLFQKDCDLFSTSENSFVKLQVENILVPGRYYISAGIFDRSNQFLDWVDKAQSFDVLPVFHNGKNFDGRYGMVTTKANWS